MRKIFLFVLLLCASVSCVQTAEEPVVKVVGMPTFRAYQDLWGGGESEVVEREEVSDLTPMSKIIHSWADIEYEAQNSEPKKFDVNSSGKYAATGGLRNLLYVKKKEREEGTYILCIMSPALLEPTRVFNENCLMTLIWSFL